MAMSGVPIGTVVAYAGPNTEALEASGWMLCDGRALDRRAFRLLFDAIQELHGQGDNVNTFNIPDYRGYFLRGIDQTAGRDPDVSGRKAPQPGGATGNQVGSVQPHEFASHSHAHGSSENSGAIAATPRSMLAGGNINHATGKFAIQAEGGSETRPINAAVNWIIKVREPG